MMRMSTNNSGVVLGGEKEWELRPGGMLVQKRDQSPAPAPPPPTMRLRVKYGSIYHEINISSQSTFGELKKMLSEPTGLHHEDQKLYFKDKERDSRAFLDTAGVKNKSKIVLQEDPISQEKRYLEIQKNAKMEKAAKCISQISLDVDILAGQVSALESVISKSGKMAEKEVVNLIELLMNQLLKLDGINADGDVKLQRKMQIRRVQKYVETLDMLKIKYSGNGSHVPTPSQRKYSNGHVPPPIHPSRHSNENVPTEQQQPLRPSASCSSVVVTTQWETFDSMPAPMQGNGAPSASAAQPGALRAQPSYAWDLL